MNITVNELTGRSADLLTTEIKFNIASARALGIDLIRLDVKRYYPDEREERRIDAISRILRSVKRQGLIQLFVMSTELRESTTEMAYLKNKYPDILSVNNTDKLFFVLKM